MSEKTNPITRSVGTWDQRNKIIAVGSFCNLLKNQKKRNRLFTPYQDLKKSDQALNF